MIKPRMKRWEWHVRERKRMHTGFWWKREKEIDHYEDIDAVWRIILKLMSEKYDGMVWTGFIWLRIGTSGGLFLRR
jgi:hypothetical protein